MRRLGNKEGFTLIELSLSIVFIAILSITIALIINDTILTYRRGLTLNQINTVGMDLVDDMRAVVQNSPVNFSSICSEGDTSCLEEHILMKKVARVEVGGKLIGESVPVAGAFCTGKYSYIWNSGYFYADDASVSDSKIWLGNYGDDFRLLKVEDKKWMVCASLSESGIANLGDDFDGSGVEELLSVDAANSLVLYDFSVPVPAVSYSGNSALYSISFILGTVQGGINVMSSGNFCKAPESYSSAESFDYCAINKFNFAAQANGRN